ncbi:hypothetical protein AMATHDRAFT_87438 [Amanita thiersii Skay4041]|uniref:AIG1-type G domain-containing protein n=1 Tax=Amanita thiersii Skay4041 TaxID=703135 RepID=A0A2A9NCW2_9AGAR|nr:hypothetical protein AMATHDRAFT_87438 [Amanita thiersii Skay4041]
MINTFDWLLIHATHLIAPNNNQYSASSCGIGPSHDNDFDDTGRPTLNTSESLSQGIIKSKHNATEYTILLVGETGTGKTSLLSLLANTLVGRSPKNYNLIHDPKIEAGGGNKHSQTNAAKVYEFYSTNGIRVRILDTPGLADTRGMQQDEQHKASIATAIRNNTIFVNAVIILANGTVPRLGVATDYALSALSAIFPRSLANNIGLLFTNVASHLSWNFDQDSLPDVLRSRDNQFLIDNPVAMWKKLKEMHESGKFPRRALTQLDSAVQDSHKKALEALGDIFDWLDELKPQATKEIYALYQQTQEINQRISNALSCAAQLADKKKQLETIISSMEGAKLTMQQFQNFKTTITHNTWVQSPTFGHNLLCSRPGCYSNCEMYCNLRFTLDPSVLRSSTVMSGGVCRRCGHSYLDHRHYNVQWTQRADTQVWVDYDAERRYKDAESNKAKQEQLKIMTDREISRLDKELDNLLILVGDLMQSYSKQSLLGCFAGQVRKSVRLIETNLEAMRNSKADAKSIEKMEKSLESMKEKLRIVETAGTKRS